MVKQHYYKCQWTFELTRYRGVEVCRRRLGPRTDYPAISRVLVSPISKGKCFNVILNYATFCLLSNLFLIFLLSCDTV